MGSTVEADMGSDISRPEARLVWRAREGQGEAREELARHAGETAYVFALQLTRSPERARDIAQESVLRFFRYLDRFDAGQRIEPWLFGIVRNQVRDEARREKTRRHESLEVWLEAGGTDPVAPDDPAAAAERHEMQVQVWHAISQLSGAHREILVLRDYHGLRYREIADVLSVPEGTVMSRLHAARTRLRDILTADHGDQTTNTTNGGASDD